MRFRNIVAAAAAFIFCTAFSSCGKDSVSEDITVTSSNTTTAETTVSESENVSESETEQSTGDTGNESDGDDSETVSENPLQPIADAALAVGEWPTLWEVNDAELLKDYFLIDASNENYRDLLVLQCPMSANMTELIIIEANDVSAAVSDLESRRSKAIEQDAFYPDDAERAGSSIVGNSGDYAYFIMGDSAAAAESAISDYIGG